MSTMPATHGHNEACCNIPPVVSTGYTPKGTYEEISDMKMKTCTDGLPPPPPLPTPKTKPSLSLSLYN